MKKKHYTSSIITTLISLVFLIAGTSVSKAQTFIKIDGNTVAASPEALKLPAWLNEDQTLAADLNVRSISVLEFTINGTAMEFSRGISVTTEQTVPDGKVWKIESVYLQTDPNVVGTWNLVGNSGTAEGTNFVGTTDSKALILKTDNVEAMRVAVGGNVGIGTTTPLSKLHIKEGSDLNLHFKSTGGVTGFAARNDANGSNVSLEMQASEFHLIGGNAGIGTTSPAELLSVGSSGTTKGVISLAGNTSGKVIIQPAAAAGSYTLTLPNTQGANHTTLQNDGSGNLSWTAVTEWASTSPPASSSFGSASDGTVTISGTTTLTSDMYYDNLTVNGTLITNGYRIFVKNTINGNGTIKWGTPNDGATPTAINGIGSNGADGAAGGAQSGSGILKNTAGTKGGDRGISGVNGGAGNVGTAGGTSTPCIGSNGAQGGQGGNTSLAGAQGGTAGINGGVNTKFGTVKFMTISMLDQLASGSVAAIIPQAASTGGGSGGSTVTSSGSNRGGAGGGGGASGGTILIVANAFAGSFTIENKGGNGGAGFNGNNIGGGGGGGAGGNGGINVVIYETKTWTGAHVLTGGTGGTFGPGTGGGLNGTAGANGATGTSYEIKMADLL